VTSYSTQWFQVHVVQGRAIAEPDPRALATARTVQADSDGRFHFAGVPAGDYYVATWFYWLGPGYFGATSRYGGPLATEITLSEGEHKDVILTQ
jgi:hypothetical protein